MPRSASAIAPRPPRVRRSQAERSASTRTRLLDATLVCLVEQGVARTTTAGIEARAGTSRGARLHHFPNKAALLSAAVEHLFVGIAERYRAAMAEVAPDADRFRAGFRLLWKTYADPSYAAVFELYNAARTDDELRAHLRELTVRHHQLVRRRANEYFPDLANRDANGLLEMLQSALSGLAVRRFVHGESISDEQVLHLIETMVEKTFPAPGGAARQEKST